MKKEEYREPEYEIVYFETEDVMTVSGEDPLPEDPLFLE